ncbi:hypothetical protein V1477_013658 [Vespula maculifrons]|uniref:Uncharacterized protein n=1 Tax=Vespula maculifrons TaxID=7453 RepID=A0ABD2BP06_VESMC
MWKPFSTTATQLNISRNRSSNPVVGNFPQAPRVAANTRAVSSVSFVCPRFSFHLLIHSYFQRYGIILTGDELSQRPGNEAEEMKRTKRNTMQMR